MAETRADAEAGPFIAGAAERLVKDRLLSFYDFPSTARPHRKTFAIALKTKGCLSADVAMACVPGGNEGGRINAELVEGVPFAESR